MLLPYADACQLETVGPFKGAMLIPWDFRQAVGQRRAVRNVRTKETIVCKHVMFICAMFRFTAELKATDAAAAAQASKAQQALEQLRQELTGKLQAETAVLRQQASTSLTSAASQHDQALMAQHAQHAQAIQKLQAEASSLASSKQGMEAEVSQLQEETQQLQGQVQALQGSMLQQAQHAQQAAAELKSEHESEKLSMHAVHAAELVALREQQAESAQEAEEARHAQQHQAEHLQATLLARFTVLEKRFNARSVLQVQHAFSCAQSCGTRVQMSALQCSWPCSDQPQRGLP